MRQKSKGDTFPSGRNAGYRGIVPLHLHRKNFPGAGITGGQKDRADEGMMPSINSYRLAVLFPHPPEFYRVPSRNGRKNIVSASRFSIRSHREQDVFVAHFF